MKKALYVFIGVLYALACVAGLLLNAYTEKNTEKYAIQKYQWMLISISLVIGVAYYIPFKKIFPIGYRKQSLLGKVFLPIVFLLLAYTFTRGVAKLVNSTFASGNTIIIKGIVKEKYIKSGPKGKKFYYITVYDTLFNHEYHLQLKRSAYYLCPDKGKYFSKKFRKGALGIVFRKEN